MSLFEDAQNEKYIAEGSTSYILSDYALNRIKKFNPNAKFIAFARNPVEQCRSWHRQLLNMEEENIENFNHAWHLQEQRARGKNLPPKNTIPKLLQYRYVASMGKHIEKLFNHTSPKQRHIVVFDDFKLNPADCYRQILDFLNLSHDGRAEFPPIYQAFKYRSPRVIGFLRKPPRHLQHLSNKVKKLRGGRSLGIFGWLFVQLEPRLRKIETLETITPELQRNLSLVFREDIERLSDILERDFSNWLYSK